MTKRERQIKNRAKGLIRKYGNHAASVALEIQKELEGKSMRFYFYEEVLIEIKKDFTTKIYNHNKKVRIHRTKRYGR